MKSNQVQELYNRRARLYDLMVHLIGHKRALQNVLSRKGLVREQIKVLDAGCGTGILSFAINSIAKTEQCKNVQLLGFDLTPAMLDRFRSGAAKEGLKPSLVQANILDLPDGLPADWKDVDLIVSSGMLEYLPKTELPTALAKLRTFLKPSGRMLIFISRDGWFNRLFLGNFWQANVYTGEELQKAFAQAGYNILSIEKHKSWGFAIEAEPSPLLHESKNPHSF